MSPAEALVDQIAVAVSERVLADLRRAPVVRPLVANVPDAAVMLGRSEKAVRSLISTGHLHSLKIDGRVQIAVAEIEALVKNNRK
jgi:hypothetical protein